MMRSTLGRTAIFRGLPPGAGGSGVRRAGQRVQMVALGVVQAQGTCDGVQDAVGDAAEVSAFQACVVLDAHACQHRDLAPAQTGHPPLPVHRKARLLGRDPVAPRFEERADFGVLVHDSSLGKQWVG